MYDSLPHACAPRQCTNNAVKISDYQEGQVYHYDYEVEAVSQMRNGISKDDQSNVKMVARISIQPLSPCEFNLQVSLR